MTKRRRKAALFVTIILSLSMIREVVTITVDGTHGTDLIVALALLVVGAAVAASSLSGLFPGSTR